MFLSCVFINFIFVFLTSGQDCNSGMQKQIHFRTDMEHNICRPVNNSDVSLGYQFCKNITFILYIIYNVRYNNAICHNVKCRHFFFYIQSDIRNSLIRIQYINKTERTDVFYDHQNNILCYSSGINY